MTRSSLALPLAAALAALAACAPGSAQRRGGPASSAGGPTHPTAAAPGASSPGVVNPAAALSLAGAGARLVDVRGPDEFADGHVPGAVNVPYDQIARRASELGPRDAPVVLYCRSGRRSAIAAETLRGLGFTRVYDAQRYDVLAEAAQQQ